MENKLLFSLDEIASAIGVHKNTVRRKFKEYQGLLIKNGDRKRFYTTTEKEMIVSLFRNI